MVMALLTAIIAMAMEDRIVKSAMDLGNARTAMVKVGLLVKHVAEVALDCKFRKQEKSGSRFLRRRTDFEFSGRKGFSLSCS